MTWQWAAFKLQACVAHVGGAVSEALVESGPGLKPRLRQWLATLSIVLPPPSKHPRLITLVSVWFYSEALSSSSSCSSSGGRDQKLLCCCLKKLALCHTPSLDKRTCLPNDNDNNGDNNDLTLSHRPHCPQDKRLCLPKSGRWMPACVFLTPSPLSLSTTH